MKIVFQEYEISRKVFKGAYRHPEGKKLNYRRLECNFWFILDGNLYTITKGFWWDGSSQPKITWSAVGSPWDEDGYPGALAHDILYATQVKSRAIADRVKYEIDRKNGMSWIKAQLIYRTLRTVGWRAWNAKTKESIEGARKHLLINGELYKKEI